MQTGLDNTHGEIVFVGDERFGLDPHDLRKLWELRNDEDLVLARKTEPAPARHASWIEKLLAFKPDRRESRDEDATGLQLIRRRALAEMQLIEQRASDPSNRRLDRGPTGPRLAVEPSRPNYLTKIKKFAWGE